MLSIRGQENMYIYIFLTSRHLCIPPGCSVWFISIIVTSRHDCFAWEDKKMKCVFAVDRKVRYLPLGGSRWSKRKQAIAFFHTLQIKLEILCKTSEYKTGYFRYWMLDARNWFYCWNVYKVCIGIRFLKLPMWFALFTSVFKFPGVHCIPTSMRACYIISQQKQLSSSWWMDDPRWDLKQPPGVYTCLAGN